MAKSAAKLLRVPDNGQISIGKKWAGRQIKIEEVGESEIHIVTGHFVSDRDMTFYTPEARQSLEEFEKWSEKNPPRQTHREGLRRKLGKKTG